MPHFLDSQYLRRLVPVLFSIVALGFIYFDNQGTFNFMNEFFSSLGAVDEAQVVERDPNDDFALFMASQHLDLLPNDQFHMYKLYLANIGRNSSNLMLDDFL